MMAQVVTTVFFLFMSFAVTPLLALVALIGIKRGDINAPIYVMMFGMCLAFLGVSGVSAQAILLNIWSH